MQCYLDFGYLGQENWKIKLDTKFIKYADSHFPLYFSIECLEAIFVTFLWLVKVLDFTPALGQECFSSNLALGCKILIGIA